MRRRAIERAAILGVLAGVAAACEALVGITDRQLATHDGAAGGEDVSTPPGTDGAEAAQQAGDGGADGSNRGQGGDAGAGTDTTPGADAPNGNDAPTPVEAGDAPPSDAPVQDAGVPDSADAAPSMDPDVPCAQQPSYLFCEDWDSVTSVGQNWGYVYSSADGGVAQIETTFVRSPPNGFQTIAPPSSTAVVGVQLGKNIGTLSSSVRVAFDLRVDIPSYANLPQVGVVQIYLTRPTGGNAQINFNVGPGSYANLNAMIADGGSPSVTANVPALTTWTRVAIAYDASGSLTLYQDGQLVGTQSLGASAPGQVNLIIGAAYVNTNGTRTMKTEMDNVVVSGH